MRPAIEIDVGGTLTLDVPEGAPSSATVTIFRGTTVLVSETAAAVADSTLSCAIAPATASALGVHLALWSYTVGSETYRRRQLFSVVAAILQPTLTPERLTTYYAGLLTGRQHHAGMTHATAIATAWVHLMELVEAMGAENAHRLLDPAPLEPAHAALAAWIIARNFAPGSATTNDWQAWAQERLGEARGLLEDALRRAAYDANDDAKITPGEARVDFMRRRLTR